MKSVRLTSRAVRDFDRAIAYSIRHFGEVQSAKYAAGLNRALLMIGRQPHIGRPVRSNDLQFRVLIFKYHLIFYRVATDRISVVKIIDARRRDAQRT